MADFIKDNLGFILADCICGGKPKLEVLYRVPSDDGFCYVRCPKCGRSSGIFFDEEDAVYYWNGHMKKKEE